MQTCTSVEGSSLDYETDSNKNISEYINNSIVIDNRFHLSVHALWLSSVKYLIIRLLTQLDSIQNSSNFSFC